MARSSDPPVPERAYQEIKRKLLQGQYRLRERLDASAIANDLGVSATPVREALLRLTAERLVQFRQAHGFTVAMWSEGGLRELYAWRGYLAKLAAKRPSQPGAPAQLSGPDYPARIASVFETLHEGANTELVAAAMNADNRLTRARVAEAQLWSDIDEELTELAARIAGGDAADTCDALDAYHQRRINAAKEIRDRAALLALPPNGT